MLRRLWWKIHDYFVVRFGKQYSQEFMDRVKTIEELDESIKKAKTNRPHLMTMQEYAEMSAYLRGETKEKPKFILLRPDYYPFDWQKEQLKTNPSYIRYESLRSAERLGRITNEERIELDNMSTIDLLHPWKREMIGMRRANFPL